MEGLNTLAALVRSAVAQYQGADLKSTSYLLTDEQRFVYAVVDVPDAPRPFGSAVVLMARLDGHRIIIEEDLHDKPLWETLVEAGVPRDHIVLAYAGEA
jgi:hypothetical protein